jgi:hypothetical protein
MNAPIIILAVFCALFPGIVIALVMWRRGTMPFFHRKFRCPCCGYLTMPERTPGTFEICPVCFWQDDPLQYSDPEYEGGANTISLNQARANFHLFGAVEQRFIKDVRKPLDFEKS